MRAAVVIAALLALTACGSGAKKSTAPSNASERCTERMLARVKGDRGPMVRSYVERTYCNRFAHNGWVYPDGTLSIKAHIWLMNGYACSSGSAGGGQTTTEPCKPSYDPLECGLLHFVRKSEAQAYIHELQKAHRVTCDDGTPLSDLGA